MNKERSALKAEMVLINKSVSTITGKYDPK
jgi:hypothetical protein